MRINHPRTFAAVAAAGLVAASLAPAAAEEDKVLYVYNWSDYIGEDTIAKFEAETGIKVTYDVFDSNEVLEAKLLAGASGYDVVVPTGSFLARQIEAGAFAALDKSKLPNLANMDPDLMALVAGWDPDNAHAIIYLWGTTGIGYNTAKVAERLGAEAPTDSWALVMDPANAAKLADCGITLLDAPTEIMQAALNWLGLDPRSTKPEDIAAAEAHLKLIAPHVRYYHSSQYINDLANGDVCVSVGWSGDVFIAATRAGEASNGVEISYVIPKEGALMWFDMMAIPADAPHPENAHKFLNFVMEAQITADITNYVEYANANAASLPLVSPEVLENPGVFPTEAAKARLWSAPVYDARADRLISRAWTSVTTGQ